MFQIYVCVTAQHRQMLDQVLALFDIRPDCDLDLMQPNQSLSDLTARIINGVDPVVAREKPDWILVQGDTTSAMVASLVAFYHQIKIAHVEAGLRSHDKFQPFPEEINRRITGTLADLHFVPSHEAKDNLLKEGIARKNICITGNTVIDALLHVASREYPSPKGPLSEIPLNKRIVLVTAHRRENLGESLKSICQAIKTIAERRSEDVHIVYPVHLNPSVRTSVYEILGNVPNITLTEPLDYAAFAHLLNQSYLVLTDSGGLQEEAPSLGKPVYVLRNTTERPEVVKAGAAKLVGTKTENIVNEVCAILNDETAYAEMANVVNPYGSGRASEYICKALSDYLVEGDGLC